jgi:hypothetical protein
MRSFVAMATATLGFVVVGLQTGSFAGFCHLVFSSSGFAFPWPGRFSDRLSRPEGRVLVCLGAEESRQDPQAKKLSKVSRRDF